MISRCAEWSVPFSSFPLESSAAWPCVSEGVRIVMQYLGSLDESSMAPTVLLRISSNYYLQVSLVTRQHPFYLASKKFIFFYFEFFHSNLFFNLKVFTNTLWNGSDILAPLSLFAGNSCYALLLKFPFTSTFCIFEIILHNQAWVCTGHDKPWKFLKLKI